MAIKEAGQYILGILENGTKFRPSDWAVRLASTFGSFDSRQRLRYNPGVKPAKFHEQNGLFVADSLASTHPDAYRFIMAFASNNHLQVISWGQPLTPQPPIELARVA